LGLASRQSAKLTSSASAEGTVAVAALEARLGDLAVGIHSIVLLDVAGAAAAVGNIRASHGDVG
jgi:hypothetical protein